MKEQRGKMRDDELLSAYIDGALTPREQARLEARLAVEPALRQRLDALQETVMLLRQLPPVPAPRNFILTPAMVHPAPSKPARPPQRWLAPALSLAAAASAVLALALLVTSLLAASQAGPTVATLGAEGQAVEVAEMPAPEASPLPEAEMLAPPEAEGAVTDTAVVSLPVRMLATPAAAVTATEEPAALSLAAPEETPGGENARRFEEPLPTEEPASLPQAKAPAIPWLPLGGLGLLTLALALASALAWRSQRR